MNSPNTIIFIALIIVVFSCQKEDKNPDPVTDIEGNSYKTVQIGNQVWMAENLKTSKNNDGTAIPLYSDTTIWANLNTPAYCWYNNDEAINKNQYGALYNGYSVNSGKLCPEGWHIPDLNEWQELLDFLGDTITAGGKMKEAGTDHWLSPNMGADNSSGFTALGAGIRYFEGSYNAQLDFTGFWSASDTLNFNQWYIGLYFGDPGIIMNHITKNYGLSIRCIKDEQ